MLCYKGVLHTASPLRSNYVPAALLQVDSCFPSGRGFTVAFDPYVLTLCVYTVPFTLFAIETIQGLRVNRLWCRKHLDCTAAHRHIRTVVFPFVLAFELSKYLIGKLIEYREIIELHVMRNACHFYYVILGHEIQC